MLTSKAYLERLDNPTPMTHTVMSEVFINMNRTVCHRTVRRGAFRGAYAVTVRFNAAPDEAALAGELDRLIADPTAVTGGEIWIALDPKDMPVSKEEQLRGGDKKIAGCLMVDTLRQADAEKIGAVLAQRLFPARRSASSASSARSDAAIYRDRSWKPCCRWPRKSRRCLKRRKETIAVAESSTGGLISAALLAQAGASAYFVGGAVVYTHTSRAALLGITEADMAGMRPSTEPYALLFARRMREKHETTWAIGETGATGPTGNRYGDAAGHSCIAVVGILSRTRDHVGDGCERPAGQHARVCAKGAGAVRRRNSEVVIPPLPPSRRAPLRGRCRWV